MGQAEKAPANNKELDPGTDGVLAREVMKYVRLAAKGESQVFEGDRFDGKGRAYWAIAKCNDRNTLFGWSRANGVGDKLEYENALHMVAIITPISEGESEPEY